MLRGRVECRIRTAVHGAESREEMCGERGNIGAPLAQWRNRHGEHIEAEEKILAETAGGDRFREIGIRERHKARFHVERIRTAQALESALFDHAQEFGLHAGSERGDFVEDDCAALCHFEAALLADHGAREGSALVAEKLGFDKFGRKAGAINFQKWSIATRTILVNPASELIFSRSAFTGDEQSGGRLGEFYGEIENGARCRVGGDPFDIRRGSFRV